MSAQIKRIGVITSGGDCQAMNAAVRAVVLSARKYNIEVVGISDAYYGMTYNRPGDFRVLHAADVENIINLGGTILNSARFTEFGDDPEYYAKLMGKNLEANGGRIGISVYDAQNLEGYQIKGTARYVTEGEVVETFKTMVEQMFNGAATAKGALIITPEKVIVTTPGADNKKVL